MIRAAEHYPGEPAPVEMLRDLQDALGEPHTRTWSPEEEWRRLLRRVRILKKEAQR